MEGKKEENQQHSTPFTFLSFLFFRDLMFEGFLAFVPIDNKETVFYWRPATHFLIRLLLPFFILPLDSRARVNSAFGFVFSIRK